VNASINAWREWREERNDVLANDIGNVYAMFRRFLSECTHALSRMLLHEWYSVAVVQKKVGCVAT
jgi:predicted DNA-binding ArsR family transcriptional regulator